MMITRLGCWSVWFGWLVMQPYRSSGLTAAAAAVGPWIGCAWMFTIMFTFVNVQKGISWFGSFGGGGPWGENMQISQGYVDQCDGTLSAAPFSLRSLALDSSTHGPIVWVWDWVWVWILIMEISCQCIDIDARGFAKRELAGFEFCIWGFSWLGSNQEYSHWSGPFKHK